MGTEQSKNEQRYAPNTRQRQGVSRDEVNQLLEQQRREYERKLQELNVRSAASVNANRNQSPEMAREADQDLDRILAQQVQDLVQIVYNNNTSSPNTSTGTRSSAVRKPAPASRPGPSGSGLGSSTSTHITSASTPGPSGSGLGSSTSTHITSASTPGTSGSGLGSSTFTHITSASRPGPSGSGLGSSTSTNITPASTPGPLGLGPSTPTNVSFERDRNPYSFTRDNLTKINKTALYPNLDAENANLRSLPVTNPTNTPERQEVHSNNNSGSGTGDYVFVNMNTNTRGCQPSAPPLFMAPTTGAVKKSFKPKQKDRDEEDQYNCKTCRNRFGLNIFQCGKGHSSCRDCKMRSAPCGVCRSPIGDTRNITLEGIIAEVNLNACVADHAKRKIACPNSADGCNIFIKMADIDAHVKECPFSDFTCPLFVIFGQRERCRWRGKLSHMVSHFDEVHPEHRQANIDSELVLLNILDDNHVVHLVDLSPFYFLVHFKIAYQKRMIYMTVQLLGTQMSASKWGYELHVYNKREPRRKFFHSDVCYSNGTPLDEIFEESKCAVIPQSYAMGFVNEGCLNYKFFIKKDFESVSTAPRGKWRGGGRGRGRGRGAKAD